jgi:hypothetical protein
MFFGLLPVTEILFFVGMIASWLYISLGIISLKPANDLKNNKITNIHHQLTVSDNHLDPEKHFHFSDYQNQGISEKIIKIPNSNLTIEQVTNSSGDNYIFLKPQLLDGRSPPIA